MVDKKHKIAFEMALKAEAIDATVTEQPVPGIGRANSIHCFVARGH
jgi:hypothetical protein